MDIKLSKEIANRLNPIAMRVGEQFKLYGIRAKINTRGKHYFRCCQMAWEVEKCQVSFYDEARYVIPTKSPDDEIIRIVDENGRELSEDDIRKIIRETISEAVRRKQEK